MLPREFLATFGRPVPVSQSIPVGGTLVIPAHPDRNLIVFWGTTADVQIHPTDGEFLGMSSTVFTATSRPLVFTHVLHGSFVNLGFTVEALGVATVFTYLMGFMKPQQQSTRKVPPNVAPQKQKPRNYTRSGVRKSNRT